MPAMFTTLDTAYSAILPLDIVAEVNMPVISSTLDTSHFAIPTLNIVFEANMPTLLVKLDTSHFEISALSIVAEANMPGSSTLDTLHCEISIIADETWRSKEPCTYKSHRIRPIWTRPVPKCRH